MTIKVPVASAPPTRKVKAKQPAVAKPMAKKTPIAAPRRFIAEEDSSETESTESEEEEVPVRSKKRVILHQAR